MSIQKGAMMNPELQRKRIPFPKILWTLLTASALIAVLVSRLP